MLVTRVACIFAVLLFVGLAANLKPAKCSQKAHVATLADPVPMCPRANCLVAARTN